MINLKQFETFITVVEENSFAAAAKQMNLTKAAVSKQITLLEQDLDVQLLNRTTRKLALTEAGQLFYDHAKRIMDEVHEAQASISQIHDEPTGHLRVTCPRNFAKNVIMPNLGEFMARYPKLILDLELSEHFPDLEREKIDILAGVTVEGSENLVRRRIGTTQFIYIASPDYLKKYGTPEKPIDLVRHRCISHMAFKDHVFNFKNDKQININPILTLNDSQIILNCVAEGIGIGKVRDFTAKKHLEAGEVVEILKEFRVAEKPIYIYYQPAKYAQPKIRAFVDFIVERMGKICPEPGKCCL